MHRSRTFLQSSLPSAILCSYIPNVFDRYGGWDNEEATTHILRQWCKQSHLQLAHDETCRLSAGMAQGEVKSEEEFVNI